VFVTDGGHYENLGLVELLRRRPANAVCLDASGDKPDVATTLAQAIQLAYEELGVVVKLDNPGCLGAGPEAPSVDCPDQLIGKLKERLAQSCAITGTVEYPDLGKALPASTGRLFFGKAVLTVDSPFDVLAHAAEAPNFPHDSTADQWFDAAQFDNYHALGRFVGQRVLDLINASTPPLQAGPPPVEQPTTFPVASSTLIQLQVASAATVLLPPALLGLLVWSRHHRSSKRTSTSPRDQAR
jgi:hypothetical protein